MATNIIFQCPVCQQRRLATPEPVDAAVRCGECQWTRDEGKHDFDGGSAMPLSNLWMPGLVASKDFPPALGLALVATAAILSCIAWAIYQPSIAIGILMVAGLIDMILYTMMGDMLVCYRCGARHRRTTIHEEHPRFDLETAERYRQQDLRQRKVIQLKTGTNICGRTASKTG